MKFFHLGDFHIGKQLFGYSLAEDQKYILNQILEYARKEKPDVMVIAGDIYDKAVPSAEAVGILDEFLTSVSEIEPKIEILMISGNHDSPERLSFAGSILEKHRLHIAGLPPKEQGEKMKKVSLKDEYGNVNFYLLPFVKPGYVRQLLKDEEKIGEKEELSYDMAVKLMLEREEIDDRERNVIASHQFYLFQGKEIERSDSEIITVGNIDSVNAAYLEGFDYAALGHIHKPLKLKETIRYCGSPLPYSVSEAGQEKGVVMVTLSEKGTDPLITMLPLKPLRKVRKIEGKLANILKEPQSDDYVSILLKEETELFESRQRLLEIFSHILEIRLDNYHIREIYQDGEIIVESLNPLEIFKEFYQEIRGQELGAEQEKIVKDMIEEIGL